MLPCRRHPACLCPRHALPTAACPPLHLQPSNRTRATCCLNLTCSFPPSAPASTPSANTSEHVQKLPPALPAPGRACLPELLLLSSVADCAGPARYFTLPSAFRASPLNPAPQPSALPRHGGRWREDEGYTAQLGRGWHLEAVREACYKALASVGKDAMHFRWVRRGRRGRGGEAGRRAVHGKLTRAAAGWHLQ